MSEAYKSIANGDRIVIPENRFYIPLEIKQDNLKEIIGGLRSLEHDKPGANVLIEINSQGGDVSATIELALVMHYSNLRISTLVTNRAHSAGIIVAAAGDRGYRYAYPESEFLVHPFTNPIGGVYSLKQWEEKIQERARADERNIRILAMLSGNLQERIEALYDNGDTYMDAEAAKELGIIDHIIPDLKS